MPVVMDADRIGRTLTRIAHEIVERNKGVEDLAFVGVRTRGVPMARRISRVLREITGRAVPVFEATPPWPAYRQADLSDAGEAFAVVAGQDAVVHAAALPDPQHNPAHVVFSNNLMATFNVIEAAVRLGVPRVVHVSSETVPGFFFAFHL